VTINTHPLGFSSDSSNAAVPARPSSRVSCPQCGAQKLARSRARSSDRFSMLFLPKRPYRCLSCYHRFWQKEAFTDNSQRVKAWIWGAGLVLGFIAWQSLTANKSTTVINASESSEPIALSNSSANARNLIEESGFQPPRSADTELSELAQAGVSRAEIRDKLKAAHVLAVANPEPNVQIASTGLNNSTPQAVPLLESGNPAEQASESDRADSLPQTNSEEQQVLNMVEQWRLAWEQGNSDRYLEFYGLDFTPRQGISRDRWQRQRRERVAPNKQIRLFLTDLRVQLDLPNDTARVRFQQGYQSATYQDESIKELQLNRIANQWYIAAEVEL